MKITVSSDANWETKVDRISRELSSRSEFFLPRNYGSEIEVMGLVLMARDPSLRFQQRVRYLKKKKELYVDIMLDYQSMVATSMLERFSIVLREIENQLRSVLLGRDLKEFDKDTFLQDLKSWLTEAEASWGGHGSGAWKY